MEYLLKGGGKLLHFATFDTIDSTKLRKKEVSKHIKHLIMNKTDLVNEIAAKASLNKVDAKKALDAVLESIAQALANDDKVQLIGFGTFAMVEKPERTGLNPRTKEKIVIPARKVVKFKAADSLGK